MTTVSKKPASKWNGIQTVSNVLSSGLGHTGAPNADSIHGIQGFLESSAQHPDSIQCFVNGFCRACLGSHCGFCRVNACSLMLPWRERTNRKSHKAWLKAPRRARPRSCGRRARNCCAPIGVRRHGRPPAEESSPCRFGSFFFLAKRMSTACKVGLVPFFLRTTSAITPRLAPAWRRPQIWRE